MNTEFIKKNKCKLISFILIIIIIILIIILIVELNSKQKQNEIENFSTNVYRYWSKKLKNLKDTHQLGKPNGVLEYIPDQNSCETSSNLLPQPDIAFKPTQRLNGCTYLDMRYPG